MKAKIHTRGILSQEVSLTAQAENLARLMKWPGNLCCRGFSVAYHIASLDLRVSYNAHPHASRPVTTRAIIIVMTAAVVDDFIVALPCVLRDCEILF